jgi:ribonuclease Z
VRGDAAVEVGFSIVLRARSLVGPEFREHPELRPGSAGDNVARRFFGWMAWNRRPSVAVMVVAGAIGFGQSPDAQPAVFRVVLLGTGTPAPSLDRLGPSILVEAGAEKLIFDVGRGVYVRLNQLGVAFADITGILFTHLHSDHVSGLPDLWLTGRFAGKPRTTRLDVWGPAGTQGMISHLAQAYEFDLSARKHLPPTQGALVPHEINEGRVFSRNAVTVSAFLVDHGDVAPAFGYRIDYGGRSVVLSGDTRLSEHLIEKSVGVDLLVHEVGAVAASASTPDTRRIMNLHLTPEEAGTVFSKVRPKLAVYSHILTFGVSDDELVSRTRKTYTGPLVVGTDLLSFDVADVVTIRRGTPK